MGSILWLGFLLRSSRRRSHGGTVNTAVVGEVASLAGDSCQGRFCLEAFPESVIFLPGNFPELLGGLPTVGMRPLAGGTSLGWDSTSHQPAKAFGCPDSQPGVHPALTVRHFELYPGLTGSGPHRLSECRVPRLQGSPNAVTLADQPMSIAGNLVVQKRLTPETAQLQGCGWAVPNRKKQGISTVFKCRFQT